MASLGPVLEVLIGGLLSGVLYSLVALGFVLIFKASGVFNFAQGAMVLLAGLALVIIPILLHLLLRQKPKKLIFPALRLIQQRSGQNITNKRWTPSKPKKKRFHSGLIISSTSVKDRINRGVGFLKKSSAAAVLNKRPTRKTKERTNRKVMKRIQKKSSKTK